MNFQSTALPFELLGLESVFGEKYGNRTRDSGITIRGFTTKLTTPYWYLVTGSNCRLHRVRMRPYH